MADAKAMSWPAIIGILVLTALFLGVTIGFLTSHFDLARSAGTAGVGAGTGVVGAFLVSRRRATLTRRP